MCYVLDSTLLKLKEVKANNSTPVVKEVIRVAKDQEVHLLPDFWNCHIGIEAYN